MLSHSGKFLGQFRQAVFRTCSLIFTSPNGIGNFPSTVEILEKQTLYSAHFAFFGGAENSPPELFPQGALKTIHESYASEDSRRGLEISLPRLPYIRTSYR